MSFLTVRHSTVYRYGEPVGLGEHRMLFRPRESYDLRLIRTRLIITPQPAHFRFGPLPSAARRRSPGS
jgi:hypothetical protein